ncbi:hypothetical protein B0T17DRAFT_509287 [Bombardia bombarda]|uniref:Uncharacterized protein n=1 Tax=Bombardia bombarda TaxID=252184 RepID=A0AA40C230_9PEZI|nr:hypothetical protein B0T17DRAFT_509287 [Bombardia bombarda]
MTLSLVSVVGLLVVSADPLSFASAAPSNLISARQQTPEISNSNCTTNSFTVPSWFIHDFHTEPSDTVSFSLLNRATNASVGLSCPAKGSEASSWSACGLSGTSSDDYLQVSVQVKQDSAGIQVRQSWSCDDRDQGHPISFTASGSTSVPLLCPSSSTTCNSANPVDLVRGSLHSPVEITPAYAEGPAGHDLAGCAAASKTPTWTVGTVIFLNETGDDGLGIQSQSIQFQVTNTASGHVAGCLNYFSAGEDEDPAVRMTCGGGVDFTRRDRYSIVTETVFYPRSWTFAINQTWFCDDIDAARPITISAAGTTTLPLTCSHDSTLTACEADAVTVHGSVLSSASLPPYSIEDPLPTPDGCTISSVVSPSWLLSNFEVDSSSSSSSNATGATGAAPASVSFNMKLNTKNNQFDYPVFVNHYDVRLDDVESWYPCAFGAGELPLAPKNCSFQYRPGEGDDNELAIKADWVCIDIDAAHPILFSGIATTTLPKLDCVTASSGQSVCTTSQGYTWVSETSNVTWRALESL